MKKIHVLPAAVRALLIVAAGSAGAVAVLAAPAIPAVAESASVTIGQLEAQGFDVKVNRIGSSPLNRCVVTDIRNPREQTEFRRVNGPGNDDVVPVVVRRTISVSLDCSR